MLGLKGPGNAASKDESYEPGQPAPNSQQEPGRAKTLRSPPKPTYLKGGSMMPPSIVRAAGATELQELRMDIQSPLDEGESGRTESEIQPPEESPRVRNSFKSTISDQ